MGCEALWPCKRLFGFPDVVFQSVKSFLIAQKVMYQIKVSIVEQNLGDLFVYLGPLIEYARDLGQ